MRKENIFLVISNLFEIVIETNEPHLNDTVFFNQYEDGDMKLDSVEHTGSPVIITNAT